MKHPAYYVKRGYNLRIEPRVIIRTLIANGDNVRQAARQLGVSPATVSRWKRRATTGNLRGPQRKYSTRKLERRSTRPKTMRITSLSATMQDELMRLRQKHGHGARKLKVLAKVPAHYSSVHRFLKAKGLTAPGKNYRWPRYQETTHMNVKNALVPGKLQMDVKYVTPELSGLVHTAYLYAVMDIWSRYKQGIILPAIDQALAIESLKYIVPLLPFIPDFIQTDNGLEFQARFNAYVTKELGWKHHHIHKSSPNENAVIERSFRTDEEEFFWRMDGPAKDLLHLNADYQAWMHYYNEERPHLSLELQTPLAKLQSVS